jgi:hypothetical protein
MDEMGHVNVLGSELARHALGDSAQARLGAGEGGKARSAA